MERPWIEIRRDGRRERHPLRAGRMRVGAAGADVVLAGWQAGELVFEDDPPRVLHDGLGPPLVRDGVELRKAELEDGDRLEWGDALIAFGRSSARPPVLEEIRPDASRASNAPLAAGEAAAWRRIKAGLCVESGLADPAAVRRWQDAVREGTFDADACARELLESSRAPDSEQLVKRSGALLRDFVMVPLTRGARGTARRVRSAAKSGTAFVVSQVVAILVYTLILIVIAVLARYRWGIDLNGWLDRVLGR